MQSFILQATLSSAEEREWCLSGQFEGGELPMCLLRKLLIKLLPVGIRTKAPKVKHGLTFAKEAFSLQASVARMFCCCISMS